MRRILLLSTLAGMAAITASAQGISVGILGGAPFQDVVKATNSGSVQSVSSSSNFTIGPSLRINLPASLRFEVDALYRPSSFRLAIPGATSDINANQWRFPVLLQYRWNPPLVKPFIEGGLSFNRLTGISDAARNITSGPGSLLHTSATGVVLGAGVDVGVPFLKVSGELRYTRDTVSHFQDISNLNQAEALI